MITVINKYQKPNSGEYIGRGNPLGNPYSHMPETRAQFRVDNRDEAVALYEAWLNAQIRGHNWAVINELNRLLNLAKEGDLELRCFCAPKRCHGDVIKKFLEAQLMMWRN
jgi:hypothetical protein